MTSKQLWLIGWTAVLFIGVTPVLPTAQSADPQLLLKEADRLAWLRAWGGRPTASSMSGDQGETDEDLDPTLAAQSWREAQALSEKIGDAAWANRAKGELGLVHSSEGDVGASVNGLGQPSRKAR
jgi:hypothetical protein